MTVGEEDTVMHTVTVWWGWRDLDCMESDVPYGVCGGKGGDEL